MKELIIQKDYKAIKKALAENPELANQGWPYDEKNTAIAHPLHRICDLVFTKELTDVEASELAKIFLEAGANVNGNKMVMKKDTPLIAASSLSADKVALLYIDHGADIFHQGVHGGTALHWASWCGRPVVVERLIKEGAEVNKKCIDYQATPLFWAEKSYRQSNDKDELVKCMRLLITAGADKYLRDDNGNIVFSLDAELSNLLEN